MFKTELEKALTSIKNAGYACDAAFRRLERVMDEQGDPKSPNYLLGAAIDRAHAELREATQHINRHK